MRVSNEGELAKWYEIPIAGVVNEPGNTAKIIVSGWRTFKPVIDQDKCTRCGICWMYCPEGAIKYVNKPYSTKKGINYGFTYEIDYDHCKGCRICVVECPVKAINTVREHE
ncbi:MAG: pyruvate ferredoxin oxidoreductase [Vulcanisaeta sp. JCHS_4]|jgi:pyruvate ferredoxin oxidoreductase, delta subunit (EC 1.2.7.1)|nr:MAG: pyruvate ferredoxin oxidoreductase [Vulcanisaeta sp. JCHS_4]